MGAQLKALLAGGACLASSPWAIYALRNWWK